MKKVTLILLCALFCLNLFGQDRLPSVEIKSLDGKSVMTDTIVASKPLVLLAFWASWCKPCHQELSAISDVYDDWKKETGVELIAISVDDSRASGKVKTVVAGNDWPFQVYLDSNQDLKRALNITNIPFMVVVKGGVVVYRHIGYTPGSELEILDILKEQSKR